MIKNFDYEYVSFEELYEAYRDCRLKKRSTYNALEFEIQENQKLYRLWNDLNSLNYEIGKSIVFCVTKPVHREVFAADFRDRIIHHLLIKRIEPIIEEEFIEDSYSCRVGKGTDYGIRKCRDYIKEATNNYQEEWFVVKCDLKAFFMTINKERLEQKLFTFYDKRFKYKDKRDLEFIKYLTHLVVMNEPQNNCIRKQSIDHWDGLPKDKSLFSCTKGFGIPIGNLTSQIFANLYLSDFDHFVKETLGIKYYGRYVDDFFILCKTTAEATEIVRKCRDYLKSEGVNLHPKKLYIQPATRGVKFIGAVIKPNRIYISNRTKGNMYATIKKFHDAIHKRLDNGGELSFRDMEHIVGSLNSYVGFLVHYATYNIRKKMFHHKLMEPIYEFCYVNDELTKFTMFKDYNPRAKKNVFTKEHYRLLQAEKEYYKRQQEELNEHIHKG